ncbi:MAG: hypothetical protein U1F87_02560 [Kiritimatiellia bacterium]
MNMARALMFACLLIPAAGHAGEFHGLRPTDPGGRSGLRNPERGLRTEAYIALPAGGHVFNSWEKPASLRGRLPAGYAPQNWRLANRDTVWWTDATGRYGANVLGLVTVK